MFERAWQSITGNFGMKLVSLIIALVLWMVVLGSRNVEDTKEVPLEVITPADLVASNDIPDKIAFRITGPMAFLRAILDRREEPIRVNLAGAKPGLITYRFYPDNIRLPIGVKVLSINPTAILIKLEYIKRREVPLHPVIRGTPPPGFRVARVAVKPDIVRIKGAETRVDSVSEIPTMPIDVTGMRQGFEREISPDLARAGVQMDGPLPRVAVDIEPVSANFRIKNVDIRVLSSYKVKLEEKAVTVLVRAEAKDLRSLDRSRVYAVVDLTGKPRGKYLENVKVILPEDVGLVKVIPEQVHVTLY